MVDNRFNKFLSVILVIILIAVFVILGFWGYDLFQKQYINASADHAIYDFDKLVNELDESNSQSDDNQEQAEAAEEENSEEGNDSDSDGSSSSRRRRSGGSVQYTYRDYNVVGKIEIPKTKIKYPIFDEATVNSMKVSVGIVYGPGLNEVGNTVIMGHNYRNGTFFSNNHKLENGDVIYITDSTGWRVAYTVYNVYTTGSSDFDYAVRDTGGGMEISLASCTSDSQSRLIIWAKAE